MTAGLGEVLWGLDRRLRGTPAEMEAFQARQLRRALAYAAANVPFYSRTLAGANLEAVRSAADLGALPIVTKRELREVPLTERLARGYRVENLAHISTAGSTGEPFHIYRSLRDDLVLGAFVWRSFRRSGVRWLERRAMVVMARKPQQARSARFSQWARRYALPVVDCLRPTEEVLADLRAIRPHTLTGYPSALCFLAKALKGSASPLRPRLVLTGGEQLLPEMRSLLSETFGAPVRDSYGAHEFNLMAWECLETGLYHVADDAVVVEVLREGRPAREGETGDVVVTGLHARANPFVRYRLGDLAVRGPSPCPCGCPVSTLAGILGRRVDYYPLPDGRTVHHYQVVLAAAHRTGLYDRVQRHQLIQERTDLFILRLAPRNDDRSGFEPLRAEVLSTLGPGCELRIDFVAEDDFEPIGKFRVGSSKVVW